MNAKSLEREKELAATKKKLEAMEKLNREGIGSWKGLPLDSLIRTTSLFFLFF